MTAEASLSVQFCGRAALIRCADPDLRRSLAGYFRHCLGRQTSVVASYDITPADKGDWQLWRDGNLLHPQATRLYLFIYLSQDIMAKLAAGCQQALIFHAAGLCQGQSGLIICGRSGSGKSTLAAWLTAAGFDFLSDEIVAIRFDPLEMTGLAWPIVLKRGSTFVWQHWLGAGAAEQMLQFFDGAAWFDPEQLRARCVGGAAQPSLLLFPRYTPDAPLAAQPLSAAEAAFRLMHQLVNFKQLPQQGFQQVAGLARQVKAYSLIYSDVTAAAAWLRGLIVP